jgi:hypothetical protein
MCICLVQMTPPLGVMAKKIGESGDFVGEWGGAN